MKLVTFMMVLTFSYLFSKEIVLVEVFGEHLNTLTDYNVKNEELKKRSNEVEGYSKYRKEIVNEDTIIYNREILKDKIVPFKYRVLIKDSLRIQTFEEYLSKLTISDSCDYWCAIIYILISYDEGSNDEVFLGREGIFFNDQCMNEPEGFREFIEEKIVPQQFRRGKLD